MHRTEVGCSSKATIRYLNIFLATERWNRLAGYSEYFVIFLIRHPYVHPWQKWIPGMTTPGNTRTQFSRNRLISPAVIPRNNAVHKRSREVVEDWMQLLLLLLSSHFVKSHLSLHSRVSPPSKLSTDGCRQHQVCCENVLAYDELL